MSKNNRNNNNKFETKNEPQATKQEEKVQETKPVETTKPEKTFRIAEACSILGVSFSYHEYLLRIHKGTRNTIEDWKKTLTNFI